MRQTYAGFNDVHLTEKLREVHGLEVCRETVRRLRRLSAVRPRRAPQYRRRRQPDAAAGSMIQVDGSPFAWFGPRGPYAVLLGAIDDATGAIVGLHFRPAEDLHGYATPSRTDDRPLLACVGRAMCFERFARALSSAEGPGIAHPHTLRCDEEVGDGQSSV
jgi:hypothetical protein